MCKPQSIPRTISLWHEVTNVGTDRHQLSNIAEQARTEMGVETLDAVADRGYYASEEIRACEVLPPSGGLHRACNARFPRIIRPLGGASAAA
jgi:hypothetical protein